MVRVANMEVARLPKHRSKTDRPDHPLLNNIAEHTSTPSMKVEEFSNVIPEPSALSVLFIHRYRKASRNFRIDRAASTG